MTSHIKLTSKSKPNPDKADGLGKQNLSRSSFQFKDNRPESILQQKLIGIANSKPVQQRKNTNGLPDGLKSGIETLSGYSLDGVKVHYNSALPAQLHAHAYAQGTEIHLGSGQEKHLPHEAWHVVQQKQGRVRPTRQLKGIHVNDDTSLENEADTMGAKALQMKSDSTLHGAGCGCGSCNSTVATNPKIIQPKLDKAAVVQRCVRCGDSTCVKGEKCRNVPSGMFESGVGTWGTKFYNEKQGHEGQPMEWEHPVPGKAYRDAGKGSSYKSAPVLQIPKTMHRSGVAGAGGGISSTGSSHSAQIWSGGMGEELATGNWKGVIWKGVIDGLNSAMATGQNLQEAAHGYYRIIMMHQERGDIDEQTAHELIAQLMNAVLNMSDRPDLFGGSKGPSKGPGPGSGGTGGANAMVVA